ncbi:MAG: hypothetical protein CMG55_09820 [Candidatus Marinimicrobia bacterium]|nr:hypothetical protein [Candidatus Neomarinimicrobiota bacterium]
MIKRYSFDDVKRWKRDGAVVLKNLFTLEEIKTVHDDIAVVFQGKKGSTPIIKKHSGPPETVAEQFLNFENIPFDCSSALNLIGVHQQLISLAREALGTKYVRLYQSQAWAKFAGETDFEQSFHCDYGNHTLTVPSNDVTKNSITFLMYFSDVTEMHGPTHYVTRSDSNKISKSSEIFLNHSDNKKLQKLLSKYEKSTAGPAGTVFAYGIDVFHRATNITLNRGYRFAVTSCFKKAGNDSIGYTAWPYHQNKPWNIIFENASPEQLNCFGVPMPGDSFWTDDALKLASLRYPNWNMKEYERKAKK